MIFCLSPSGVSPITQHPASGKYAILTICKYVKKLRLFSFTKTKIPAIFSCVLKKTYV